MDRLIVDLSIEKCFSEFYRIQVSIDKISKKI